MIKVLIVDDSPVMQQLLNYTISSDPELKVVGIASNGEEAIEMVKKLSPHVIAMDWHMPKLNGKEATSRIMETNPTPIVIVTGSLALNDQLITFDLMEAGALALVKKPPSIDHPEYKKQAQDLIRTLKLMSEIKMVRRIRRTSESNTTAIPELEKKVNEDTQIKVVVMGASTGGPQVLQKILSGLPKDIPVPLFIVQHISKGFTKGFVEWLNKTTGFQLHVAAHGEFPLPGHVYVAPDDFHMGIEKGPRIMLYRHELENGMRPSVSFLFRTAALNFGSRAVGVLLTGMGHDGAEELKLMKDKGSITFAQDKETSIVFGMPGEAVKLDAATHILSPEEITVALTALINKMNG